MEKAFRKKLLSVLLLAVMTLCACASFAENSAGEGIRYYDLGELNDRAAREATYTKTGSLKTGNEVTFTIRRNMNKAVDSYSIARKPDSGKIYQCVYDTHSGTMTYVFYQPGTYRLFVNYQDGDWDYTAAFTVTGSDKAAAKAKEIVAQCPAGDDYERALWLHDWLAKNSYIDTSLTYFGADGVLCRGCGVGQSYAEAYRLLLKTAGIGCGLVLSDAMNREWNVIRLNGKWYMCDLPGDVINRAPAGEGTSAGYCFHGQFALPTALFSYDHYGFTDKWNCTSMQDNYYMREEYGARIMNGFAGQISDAIDWGAGQFNLDAGTVVEENGIEEAGVGGTLAVRGDIAAEIAARLLNGTYRQNKTGTWFYLKASHRASSYDTSSKTGTMDTTVQLTAYASSGTVAEGITWRYKDGTLTISGTGTLPSYDGKTVPWAAFNTQITSVVLSEGIKAQTTGEKMSAFRDCVNMTRITIPESMAGIGASDFDSFDNLKLANVICGSDGLTAMQDLEIRCLVSGTHKESKPGKNGKAVCGICGKTFAMTGDGVLSLPSSLTKMGAKAFSGSTAKTVVIPKNCTAIPADAFEGCTGVTTLILPKALKDSIQADLEAQLTDIVLMTY